MKKKRAKIVMQDREPEEGPPFQFCPGRYYLGMWFVNFKPEHSMFGNGGDITFMVWRKDSEPNLWYMLFRFRHYKDERVFDSEDVRNWRMMKATWDTEKQAESEALRAFNMVASVCREDLETFWIRGYCNRAHDLLMTQKPHWMQMQQQRDE